jgi:hypothetical protein
MKRKKIFATLAVLFIVGLISSAYATYDSHSHTGDGTIDTWPTITVTGSHKIRVCAPTTGRLEAYDWTSQGGIIAQIVASNGSGATSSNHTLTAGSNVLFSSWVSGYGSGSGRAQLADNGTLLANCSSQ